MVTADEARKLLDYDPASGQLFWRRRPDGSVQWNARFAGKRAGSPDSHGRRQITINAKVYREHRVIWLWVYGAWPSAQVDHENTKKADNRLANLRDATNAQNGRNRGAVAGLKGASFHVPSGRWRARITVDYREIYLGLFPTESAAHAAYVSAARRHHGEFARAA